MKGHIAKNGFGGIKEGRTFLWVLPFVLVFQTEYFIEFAVLVQFDDVVVTAQEGVVIDEYLRQG